MGKSLEKKIKERANQILSKMKRACNCGGPQYGTDHSPDCEWIQAQDRAWDFAKMEIEDEEAEAQWGD